MGYKYLNIEKWSRKDHFLFFSKFEEPFFGICSRVDCTKAIQTCKNNGYSFFQFYLHACLQAVNSIIDFRYRIQEGKVLVYDEIGASSTVNRPNGTFGFSYIPFERDFIQFSSQTTTILEEVRNSKELLPSGSADNVIHFSVLPWLDFTSVSHARPFSAEDSCPKITIGKVIEHNGKSSFAVSIHAHHALMDGYHIGLFVEAFQKQLDS